MSKFIAKALNENSAAIKDFNNGLLSGKAMVNLYNALSEAAGGKSVSKFASKAAGTKRLEGLILSLTPAEAFEDKSKTEDKPKTADKSKTEDKPKPHRASDSWRNLKALQSYFKEEIKIEGIGFGMSVIGGVEGFLRDQLSVKVKGKRDPIARIKIALGEAEARTLYTDETELVLSNDNELVLAEVTSLIEKYTASVAAELEAKKAAKAEK